MRRCRQRRHTMRAYLEIIATIIGLLCAYVALLPLLA
jgi:nicotinamide riboside transporter PnuC